jgi:hypothetical protein
MAVDKEFLKKHHFWVLLAPQALFLLLVFVFISFGVGGATAARLKEIEDHGKKLNSTQTLPKQTVDYLAQRKGRLEKRRDEMWKAAWEMQKSIFTWPKKFTPNQYNAVKDFSFGDEKLDDTSNTYVTLRSQYIKAYREEFTNLEKDIEPLQMFPSMEDLLKPIPASEKRPPTAEDIWLSMEDLWVQRLVIEAISNVNTEAAEFNLVSDPADKLKRKFKSRIWEIDLEIQTNKDNKQLIIGKIKNHTDRMQVFGVGNMMGLEIWLDPAARQPFLFLVAGEYVKAGETMPIKTVPQHTIDVGIRATEITKVRQVFDGRTVPVKRIDQLVLGYPSSRTMAFKVVPSKLTVKSKEKAAADAPAAATPGDPGAGAATPMMSSGSGATASANFSPLGRRRYRYIALTDQVRRMPIGVTLIVDQAHIQDVLLSLMNSKLRFQVTQDQWNRYRGPLDYLRSRVAPVASNLPQPKGTTPPTTPFIPGKGSPSGTPGGIFPMGSPMGSPMSGPGGRDGDEERGGFPGGPGSLYNPQGGFFGNNAAVASRDKDAIANSLVELNVYGIASLYENYDIYLKKQDTANGGTPTDAPKN